MFAKLSSYGRVVPSLGGDIAGIQDSKNVRYLISDLITLINSNTVTGSLGVALPSTVPSTAAENGSYYIANGTGTYTNFKDSTNASIVVNASDNFTYLLYNGTYWTKVASTVDLSAYTNLINSLLTDSGPNLITSDDTNVLTSGSYLNSTGALVTLAGYYVSTLTYDCKPGQTWYYKGITASAAMAAVGYNSSGTFVQVLLGGNTNSNTSFTSVLIPTGVTKIRFSFRNSTGDVQEVQGPKQIAQSSIEGFTAILNQLAQIELTLQTFAYTREWADPATQESGYVTLTGTVDSSGSAGNYWYNSGLVAVKPGQTVQWRGTSGSVAVPLFGYDASGTPVSALIAANTNSNTSYITATIPSGVYFVRATFREQAGVNYSFLATAYDGTPFIETVPDYLVPQKVWAYNAEVTRLNPNGCVANSPASPENNSLFWFATSNQRMFAYTFTTGQNDISIPLVIMDKLGKMRTVGSTVAKITHTPQSPSTARNIIAMGDSTTQTTANASVHGVWINEVSRRLTGTGTAAISSPSPTALALTNLYFRGTLGDNVIKHEGRGGWGFGDYMTKASYMFNTNAFYDASISGDNKFSLDYYLSTNNFLDSQTTGGVTSTGDNLTILIQLGWNQVFQQDTNLIYSQAKAVIDVIHAQKPSAHVKLIGLAPPPELPRADATARGHATPISIMREAILSYGKICQRIEKDSAYSGFVEYIHIGAQFFPENSFSTTVVPYHNRTTSTQTFISDYIHCNATGYAQIADIVFYNLLYNYCRAN